MSEWISVKERLPPLEQKVLVLAKEDYYWEDIHGKKDERPINFYVGCYYDINIGIENLKPKLEFEVTCGCSGPEFDRATLEVLHWLPLSAIPRENE